MIIKKLCEMSGEMVTGAVELLYGSQITGNQSRDDIKNFICGRCFDNGRFMLAAVEDGRVVATGGAVVAEIDRHEIFITALAAASSFEAILDEVVRALLSDIAEFSGCRLKLGVKGDLNVPAGFPESFGFCHAYSLLQMRFAAEQPAEEDSAHIELPALSPENIDEYVSVTNAGFDGTPNVSTIDAADAKRLLANEAFRCGLIRTDNRTVGCYELKLDSSAGWIESVCLLPASRGHGLGRAAVAKLIRMLHQLGYETVKLSVIDINEKAYSLYQRMGFSVDRVLSRWYVKNGD
jgi:ribosomal protein S18 acetylase RimI-like enzyme